MSEREVRLGIVGAGGMGSAHVRNLAKIPQARLVAVGDWDEAQAHKLAEPFGAAVYTNGAQLIEQAGIEALYICVPPHTHEDLETRAAARRLHLYVEKPVNLYLDRARAAQEAIQKAGVMTQVGYQLRYLPAHRRLKAFLADKQVGTAHVSRWSGAPGKDWWRRYDQGGGQLVEMTTHQVDLLRWLLGEVEAVSARYSFDRLFQGEPGLTVPDSQAVLMQFASGATATLTTSCALGKAWMGGLDFVLKGARVTLNGEEIRVDPEDAYAVPPLLEDNPALPALSDMTLAADTAFVRAVATGDSSLLLSPYADGLKSAAVTLAANRSAEEGGRVVALKELLP
jgi:predicted dehydrogenase